MALDNKKVWTTEEREEMKSMKNCSGTFLEQNTMTGNFLKRNLHLQRLNLMKSQTWKKKKTTVL